MKGAGKLASPLLRRVGSSVVGRMASAGVNRLAETGLAKATGRLLSRALEVGNKPIGQLLRGRATSAAEGLAVREAETLAAREVESMAAGETEGGGLFRVRDSREAVMKGKGIKILWKGQAVGEVFEPRVDNFDFYGRWVPSPSDAAAEFLSALRAGDQLEVQVGDDGQDLAGTVEVEPEGEIEIKLRPGA